MLPRDRATPIGPQGASRPRGALRASIGAALLAIALAGGCDREPDLLAEHLRRGDKALAEARWSEAVIAYRHAYDLAPHDARVQRGTMRARVHLMAESPGKIAAEAVDDVRYEAQVLLDQDKGQEVFYLTAIANVLARHGDVEGARAKLAEALKADPSSPVALASRGTLLLGTKDGRGEAREAFEAALKAKPDCVAALVGLAQIKLADGDAAGAAERLEVALRQGEDYGVRLSLGNARLSQQRAAEAAEHFRRAAELDPRSADAASLLGQALLAAGQPDAAERALRAALQLRADEASQTALGFALLRQKKAEQALAVFRGLLADDATLASAVFGAASASDELGRSAQALEGYKRLLSLPVEGRQKGLLTDLRPDAERRVAELQAALAAAAPSAAPDAGAPRPARPH